MERYKIVKRGSIANLEPDVNNLIASGYEPIGGIAFCDGFHCQAMLLPANATIAAVKIEKPAKAPRKKAAKRA